REWCREFAKPDSVAPIIEPAFLLFAARLPGVAVLIPRSGARQLPFDGRPPLRLGVRHQRRLEPAAAGRGMPLAGAERRLERAQPRLSGVRLRRIEPGPARLVPAPLARQPRLSPELPGGRELRRQD